MEGKSVRAIVVMVVMVLGMLARHTTADFLSCYGLCYIECWNAPPSSKWNAPASNNVDPQMARGFKCAFKCLRRCIGHSSSHANYYCKLGCASDLCANFSNDHPKMEGCVNSCSSTCDKNI